MQASREGHAYGLGCPLPTLPVVAMSFSARIIPFVVLVGCAAAALVVYSCSEGTSPSMGRRGLPEVALAERTPVTNERILNDEASVPPQCYTKTEGRHNPCYGCHQLYDRRTQDRLNQLDDGALQGTYTFSDIGITNHWRNLFVDRRAWLKAIDDAQILAYVDTDNYRGLAERLHKAGFRGFVPDLANYAGGAAAFDREGLARDGSAWVAFNYKPFLGTFWPTNGSTDDVVIRLPRAFRELSGEFNRDAYFVNLTLVELSIKDLPRASIWPIDERVLGVDIDGDGKLAKAVEVARRSHYIADARAVALTFQQFPQGTELMHSVRYLGVADDDRIVIPQRMKELRYMRKVNVLDRYVLESRYANERKEKRLGELPSFIQRGDSGLDNGQGWFVQGFIEDYEGELRPQSHEETMFCMGCHAAIGTTIDSTFSFARKVTGAPGFRYVELRGMHDAPSVTEQGGEILNYLRRAGGGSEFRQNEEMAARWYRPDGSVDEEKVKQADVYTLLAPSVRRALDLNKAYTHIVRHQSYIFGRDATWKPSRNVYESIDEANAPLDEQHQYYGWDLRLAWPN
jgi:hypothetical protein